jgi:hypothetical protein
MITKIKHSLLIVLSITTGFGCGLIGPTDREISAAIEAVMRGVQSSVKKENMEVQQEFVNSADVTFTNNEKTVSHDMRILINEDKSAALNGECKLEEYSDIDSNYTITGSFDYDLFFPDASNNKKAYGEISLEMDYTGGRIEFIDLYVTIDKQGKIEKAFVNANGFERDYNKKDKIYNFFKYLNPSVVK